MQERIATLFLSPSFVHTVLLILCQDAAEPQPWGRVSISTELFPASSHLTWELYAWLSCALLIRVKIYPTTKVYLHNFSNEHCFKYWIKNTFIGQQFYMSINTWIRYVMSWIYKVDKKTGWLFQLQRNPFTFFKYFFKSTIVIILHLHSGEGFADVFKALAHLFLSTILWTKWVVTIICMIYG